MKIEHTRVYNIYEALLGMRNPLNSWEKSDSRYTRISSSSEDGYSQTVTYSIGPKDLELAQKLIKSGPEHRKFLRQIFVSVNLTLPLYVWKEMDQYRVSVTTNSCSTMHKLASTPITKDCFEFDKIFDELHPWASILANGKSIEGIVDFYLENLERIRKTYLETKDIRYWRALVQLLPESWLQTRTWTANYEVLRSIYTQRRNHKLKEWNQIIEWIESLPYAKELICYGID